MANEKSKYLVVRPIKHNKQTFAAGTTVDFSDAEAGHLLLTGAISAVLVVAEPVGEAK